MEGLGKLTCEQFHSMALCVIFLWRPRVFFNNYGLNSCGINKIGHWYH